MQKHTTTLSEVHIDSRKWNKNIVDGGAALRIQRLPVAVDIAISNSKALLDAFRGGLKLVRYRSIVGLTKGHTENSGEKVWMYMTGKNVLFSFKAVRAGPHTCILVKPLNSYFWGVQSEGHRYERLRALIFWNSFFCNNENEPYSITDFDKRVRKGFAHVVG